MPARILGLGLVVAVAVLVIRSSSDEAPSESVRPATPSALSARPNLVVVMTDDQTVGSFNPEVMPQTHEFFSARGVIFNQAIAAPPLCCPSRAGFLTGRYAHNNGVVDNTIGYGSLRGKGQTLPVALAAAGYRTGMFGKFLNGYGPAGGTQAAPGFDRWLATYGYADYFNYQVSDDGELRTVPEYSTRYFTTEAIGFTREAAEDSAPFFLWLSYNAPHTVLPGYPPPCDGLAAQPSSAEVFSEFADSPLPRPPSFNEADTSDKPQLTNPPLREREIREIEQGWRCNLAAMRDVDTELHRLLDHLERDGELENTVVVYLSDNGYYYGEHRLTTDKRLPLEPALRIPMAISVGGARPSASAPPELDLLVSQVDIAPTLADYAGVEPCDRETSCLPYDGRSLRGPLEGVQAGWPADRAIPMVLADGWTYQALRTPDELYMEISENRKGPLPEPAIELYDLAADPDQLENLAASPDPETEARLRELAARLERLQSCTGHAQGSAPPPCD